MKKPIERKEDVPTTGHSWDGIEEFDNPMPRWWLWTFYATIVWGVAYTIAYPAWPLISGATAGLLGYSTRAEVVKEIDAATEANAAIDARLASVELDTIASDPELTQYAISNGAAVFRTNCSQCHGSGAASATGFPNLLDDDWLWGGTIYDIHYTVTHGIRNTDDPDARYSQMPAFGEILENDQIEEVANYVMSLSEEPDDAEKAKAGSAVFDENCTACHGEQGLGDREVGAPNLADAVWLYGGDIDSIEQTVTYSRFGVMPHWGERLSESQIRAVASYVHQLGGGEEADVADAPVADSTAEDPDPRVEPGNEESPPPVPDSFAPVDPAASSEAADPAPAGDTPGGPGPTPEEESEPAEQEGGSGADEQPAEQPAQ